MVEGVNEREQNVLCDAGAVSADIRRRDCELSRVSECHQMMEQQVVGVRKSKSDKLVMV